MNTDKQRLDWLAKQDGSALLSDDAGRWAISWDGCQNVPDLHHVTDIETSFFIEAKGWRRGIRRTIDAAMRAEKQTGKRE